MAQITVRVSGKDRADPTQRLSRTFHERNSAEARSFTKRLTDAKTTWYVRVSMGGKTMSRAFPSRAEAVAWSHDFESEKRRGEAIDPRAGLVTFESFAQSWLTTDPSKRGSSLARDRAIVEQHLIPALGSRKLTSIRQPDVQALVNKWVSSFAPSTVARHFTTLQAILSAAVRAERIGRSPCVGIRLPERPVRDSEILDPGTVAALANAVGLAYGADGLPRCGPRPEVG